MPDTEAESSKADSLAGDDPGLQLSDLPSLSTEELNEESKNISNVIARTRNELEMLEKYISRLDPKDLEPLPLVEGAMSSMDFVLARGRRRSRSRSSIADRLHALTMDQKSEIAQRELEKMKEELETLKEHSDRLMHFHKATMEEAEVRLVEIKKAISEFDRDVAKPALKKKNTVITSEKVMRYIEDKLRARDMLTDKLRLKNVSLKVQKKKLRMQLKQKDEIGEVLHEVDFQQLKIENSQFLERIDERNQDLLHLKLTAGTTLQILTSYKKKLQNATDESSRLNREITLRRDMLQRIEMEAEQVEEERSKAEAQNKALRRQLADFRVPPIFDYVEDKMENSELEKNIKAWERKVDIAEMSMKTYRKAWDQIKTASSQALAYGQLYSDQ
ncbi:cilia- and flagella-associated protein 263 [Ambystoma mexicanum]|uniref:cilia- and flagella-associated protein 263 n=1 Tax=Ambystoma mexicanum TaxID=8296 RepID=UPI0037E77791